jgi:hypothetical protein
MGTSLAFSHLWPPLPFQCLPLAKLSRSQLAREPGNIVYMCNYRQTTRKGRDLKTTRKRTISTETKRKKN